MNYNYDAKELFDRIEKGLKSTEGDKGHFAALYRRDVGELLLLVCTQRTMIAMLAAEPDVTKDGFDENEERCGLCKMAREMSHPSGRCAIHRPWDPQGEKLVNAAEHAALSWGDVLKARGDAREAGQGLENAFENVRTYVTEMERKVPIKLKLSSTYGKMTNPLALTVGGKPLPANPKPGDFIPFEVGDAGMTCDWGSCNRRSAGYRFSGQLQTWLPCCKACSTRTVP